MSAQVDAPSGASLWVRRGVSGRPKHTPGRASATRARKAAHRARPHTDHPAIETLCRKIRSDDTADGGVTTTFFAMTSGFL